MGDFAFEDMTFKGRTIGAKVKSISILVESRSDLCRFGYIWVLKKANFKNVRECKEDDEFFRLVWQLKPDVFLLDIDYSDYTYFTLVDELRQKSPTVHPLILYSEPHESMACRFAKSGVQGIVHKLEKVDSFITAVRAVAGGYTWFSPGVTTKLSNGNVAIDCELTSRELTILQLLVQGKTNHEIASVIHIAERTIRYNLQKIYDKIQVDSRCQAISWMIQHGYIR